MSYTNADGLRVLTFKDQGAVQDQGATVYSPLNYIVIDVNLADLTDTVTASDIDVNDPVLPAGAAIQRVTVLMKEAATSGGSATLDIGTYVADGSAIDADGIDADIALTAIDADNDVVVCDGALVGGIFSTGASPSYIVPTYETAAFTAGRAKIVVEYIV